MLKQLLLFVFLLQISNAADCPICPTGGIWSEWTSTGVCATTCGACSNLNYTRTCLSDGLKNCPCVGSTTITQPCGTQACNYPRTNGPGAPCCIGTPKIVNNWYHYASTSQTTPTAPCCPTGGVWSDWSSWVQNGNLTEYTRTRNCLSGGFSCACVGESEETKFECPCTPMKTIPKDSTACAHLTSKTIHNVREPYMDKAWCRTYYALEASDFRFNFSFMSSKFNEYMSTAAWIDNSGKCTVAEFPRISPQTHGGYYRMGFFCDPVSKAWYNSWGRYELNMTDVTQFAQFYTP